MGKKSKKSKAVESLPKRTIQSYEDEISQKLKVIEELECQKDRLDVETDELKEYLESNGSAQQDIKDFIEKKVIKKEDKIDLMIDIEEEHLKVSKEVINELNIKLEAEADDLKEKLSVITHAFNKIDQESSKHYEIRKARAKLNAQIEAHKKTLRDNEERNTDFLYEKAKQMVYCVERNKVEMETRIDELHRSYSQFSRPQILRVSQVQIINNKRLRRKLTKADAKSTALLNRVSQLKRNLRLTNQEINVFHDKATDNTKNQMGTIPVLTKLNAVKAKEINDLVLEYKEIERTLEGQHSRDKLFETLNTELQRNELELDVKFQDDKIHHLQHTMQQLKKNNDQLNTKIKLACSESDGLAKLLREIMAKSLNNTMSDDTKYGVLNTCIKYDLLSNALTVPKLKCGELGFV